MSLIAQNQFYGTIRQKMIIRIMEFLTYLQPLSDMRLGFLKLSVAWVVSFSIVSRILSVQYFSFVNLFNGKLAINQHGTVQVAV